MKSSIMNSPLKSKPKTELFKKVEFFSYYFSQKKIYFIIEYSWNVLYVQWICKFQKFGLRGSEWATF